MIRIFRALNGAEAGPEEIGQGHVQVRTDIQREHEKEYSKCNGISSQPFNVYHDGVPLTIVDDSVLPYHHVHHTTVVMRSPPAPGSREPDITAAVYPQALVRNPYAALAELV